MPTISQLLAEGQLRDALIAQEQLVQADPRSPENNLLLHELQFLSGHFSQAATSLEFIHSHDADWPAMAQFLMLQLQAARLRERGIRTRLQNKAPAHLLHRWRAACLRDKDPLRAIHNVDRADEKSPRITGFIDGREFEGLRDTDDRFGSILEVFLDGNYAWIPFEQLRRVRWKPAESTLEMAYRPALITWVDRTEQAVVLPMVYPNSASFDGAFALGQDTDWPEANGLVCGIGARIWMIGEDEVRVTDCSELEIR